MTKIFGHDWQDIQRAQQGGRLNKPLPPVDRQEMRTQIHKEMDRFQRDVAVEVAELYQLDMTGYEMDGTTYRWKGGDK